MFFLFATSFMVVPSFCNEFYYKLYSSCTRVVWRCPFFATSFITGRINASRLLVSPAAKQGTHAHHHEKVACCRWAKDWAGARCPGRPPCGGSVLAPP